MKNLLILTIALMTVFTSCKKETKQPVQNNPAPIQQPIVTPITHTFVLYLGVNTQYTLNVASSISTGTVTSTIPASTTFTINEGDNIIVSGHGLPYYSGTTLMYSYSDATLQENNVTVNTTDCNLCTNAGPQFSFTYTVK